MGENKPREFTYEDGFEDGVQSGKEECIEIVRNCSKEILKSINEPDIIRRTEEQKDALRCYVTSTMMMCISKIKNSM